jgi:hypothetical protein
VAFFCRLRFAIFAFLQKLIILSIKYILSLFHYEREFGIHSPGDLATKGNVWGEGQGRAGGFAICQ